MFYIRKVIIIKSLLIKLLPGMRIIKTGLAILICMLLGWIFKYYWPVYACLAAIVAMQDTPGKSIEIGIARLIGTFIGGLLGIAFLSICTWLPYNAVKVIICPVAVIIAVMICVIIKQRQACSICAVVVISIILLHTTDSEMSIAWYALSRTLETAMGVLITVLINRFIWSKALNEAHDEKTDECVDSEEVNK